MRDIISAESKTIDLRCNAVNLRRNAIVCQRCRPEKSIIIMLVNMRTISETVPLLNRCSFQVRLRDDCEEGNSEGIQQYSEWGGMGMVRWGRADQARMLNEKYQAAVNANAKTCRCESMEQCERRGRYLPDVSR